MGDGVGALQRCDDFDEVADRTPQDVDGPSFGFAKGGHVLGAEYLGRVEIEE